MVCGGFSAKFVRSELRMKFSVSRRGGGSVFGGNGTWYCVVWEGERGLD